jgi:carbamoyl-phosphate synthase/aspartate carbamoyltransferase
MNLDSSTDVMEFIHVAETLREDFSNCSKILNGKVLGLLFYEPSTRTMASFQSAMQKLGGTVIVITPEHSSIQKGESLEDTIRTLCCYCDVIVLRHPESNSFERAQRVSTKPLINGGNGASEHPTQAMMDLYTIWRELGYIAYNNHPVRIAFVGDLNKGRTVHSLVKLLTTFDIYIQYIFISPPEMRFPQRRMEWLRERVNDEDIVETELLEPYIPSIDVLYMTRVQKERQKERNTIEISTPFILNKEKLKHAKENMIVMHPLPRNDEIDPDVDDDPRAAYFRQVENGLFLRMAILLDMCGAKCHWG